MSEIMYKKLSKLVIYKNIQTDSILFCLADIIEKYERGQTDTEETVTAVYGQIHRLLDVL